MSRDILYFVALKKGCKFVYEHKKYIYRENYSKVLNRFCLEAMSTIEGRVKAMSKLWGSSYNVPLYVNKDMCFLKIERNLWINVFNIDKINGKYVVFKCGKIIYFASFKRKINDKIQKVMMIIKNVEK